MSNNNFQQVSFLENKKFFIPSYQRGYRWNKQEVNDLLEDIEDFMLNNQSDIYSLQPIVLKEDKQLNHYRVIDGQQRLTTIFIIIKYLKQTNFFEIKYETRLESYSFLNSLDTKNKNDESYNIDFYYFVMAYDYVYKFFSDKDFNFKDKFYNTLINSCHLLWYEISEEEKEEDVFIRLNIGKIPLMVEENIKALFLANKDPEESLEVAKYWYESEKKLRENNDFRFCVLKKINKNDLEKNSEGNNYILNDDFLRIRVYLEAISSHSDKQNNELFNYFYGLYKNKKLKDEFEKLIECMSAFNTFSIDKGDKIQRRIFHYIGFLILSGVKIEDIYHLYQDNQKDYSHFADSLFNKIKNNMINMMKGNNDSVEDYIKCLYFYDNPKEINTILLLANIHYLLEPQTSMAYFKFNRFQLEEWSLEHIYALESQGIKTFLSSKKDIEIELWLNDIIKHIDSIEEEKITLSLNIEKVIKSKKFNNDDFNNLIDEIDNYFKDNSSINSIGNLCLLDKRTNSSISNFIFSEKQEIILELANNDRMIPILTQKVFNKDFSNKTNKTDIYNYFSEQNREDYMNFIISILEDYFKN